MNVLVWLLVAAVIYGSGFATGWKVDTWKNTAENAAQLKAAQELADERGKWADKVSDDFEQRLAHMKIVHTTINNEVRHEVEKPVYVDPNCNLPESGRVLRDAAIDAANAAGAGQPAPAVPADPKVNGADVAGGSVPSGSRTNQPIR